MRATTLDPHAIAVTAAARLAEREERFAEFWREQSGSEQDDLLMEVVRKVTLFQGSFPPLRELRREMAPITELPVKAQLLGGDAHPLGQDRPGASACRIGWSRAERRGSPST